MIIRLYVHVQLSRYSTRASIWWLWSLDEYVNFWFWAKVHLYLCQCFVVVCCVFFFSVRLLSVLRGHSVFFIPYVNVNLFITTIQNFILLKSHKMNTWVYMYNATYNNWWQGLMGEGGKPARKVNIFSMKTEGERTIYLCQC